MINARLLDRDKKYVDQIEVKSSEEPTAIIWNQRCFLRYMDYDFVEATCTYFA
ncbi:MAG: hypothetical protein PUP93_16195 [Rhizonema sp. NSF051]|nr:hypothetical protein [Rhizonema sp. NSF051]